MNKKIIAAVNKLEMDGVTGIEMLALVSETSYEVVFYGDCQGQRLQSNAMVENGLIDADVVDDFYKAIAQAVRSEASFDKDKMNIVKYYKDGTINLAYDEKNCRVYSIKKEWKKSL